MKKANIKSSAGIIIPIVLGIILLSYGNTKNHPTLNGFVVKSFISKVNKDHTIFTEFKNYKFNFEKPKLKGDYITESGLLNPSELDNFKGDQISNLELAGQRSTYTEKERAISPREWIEHGGFSADVPEVPASLRHFYDPTKREGERYLTDKVNSVVMKFFQSGFPNPETDGVDWALGTKGNYGVLEHTYTWEHGKKYIQGALEEANLEKRNKFMAHAWRSLGETLHMIADNGCPPHVRNDGHPAIPITLLSYFGNPDPYEELMDGNSLSQFEYGKTPTSLVTKFNNAKTAKDIAHQLAVFTNKNFLTQETISGTTRTGKKIKQITHPSYEYASPKISAANYEDGYYKKDIEGVDGKVLMCTDKWFFSKFNIPKSYPYVDKACVYSQAKVLVPAIKTAGAYVMRLYIPKLKITILNFKEDGSFNGFIKHTTDKEYLKEIKYNGPVNIISSGRTITTVTAKNGKFSGKANNSNSKITAEIEFGGITVSSEPISKIEKKAAPVQPKQDKMKVSVVIYVYSNYTRGFKDKNQTFENNTFHAYEADGDWKEFTVERGNKFKGSNSYGEIEGEMNEKEIVWLKIKYHDIWKSGSKKTREETWEAEMEHIPLSPEEVGQDHTYGKRYTLEGWDFDNVRPNPAFQKNLKKLEHEIVFYPSGEKAILENVDFTETGVKTTKQLLSQSGMFQPRPYISVGISYNVY